MLFYSLYCDILSLTSLKIIQAFHLLLGFVQNQTVFWDFKIRNSVRITEGSDNGDSDNRGPTVFGVGVHRLEIHPCLCRWDEGYIRVTKCNAVHTCNNQSCSCTAVIIGSRPCPPDSSLCPCLISLLWLWPHPVHVVPFHLPICT